MDRVDRDGRVDGIDGIDTRTNFFLNTSIDSGFSHSNLH